MGRFNQRNCVVITILVRFSPVRCLSRLGSLTFFSFFIKKFFFVNISTSAFVTRIRNKGK